MEGIYIFIAWQDFLVTQETSNTFQCLLSCYFLERHSDGSFHYACIDSISGNVPLINALVFSVH